MTRPASDWQAQDRGAWEYEQWRQAAKREARGVNLEPDFPVEVFES